MLLDERSLPPADASAKVRDGHAFAVPASRSALTVVLDEQPAIVAGMP